MRSILAAFVLMMGMAAVSGSATAEPMQSTEPSMGEQTFVDCTPVSNVDSCWEAGVAAEKRGDAKAALAAYQASCDAGFQVGGCYEAGKIYFLNVDLRDYGAAQERMEIVCGSDDVGIGPYACKYLGIIHRKGLTGEPRIDRAFTELSRACFLHNPEPFIDGNGCEVLADSIPDADEMGVDEHVWQPEYIAYLAFAMGCSDDMPGLCDRALAIYSRAEAQSASWLGRCAEDVEVVGFAGQCRELSRAASVVDYDQRQAFRRRLVNMYHRATEFAG
ncbi:hypothetical protein [Azospirillum formosense]|uniref:hypothetical protein n=1 Tax=Azospirillum formosense TaxID=861533 RepID=UPI001C901E6E|nr:hypothetical protein [Azospirillum formosense]MBY3757048.1 hypothetical protein [Azospirillum formosense]